MHKLLIICGPTATGKTKLALQLGKEINEEIISADSRQVYKYMDIGTGKDRPDDDITIWGYDLAEPKDKFSISHYKDFAINKLEEIWGRGSLPVMVGGSGFYIKSVVDGVPTIDVGINKQLRNNLSGKSAFELFNMLAQLSPEKAKMMNISDRNNPRRLIRAIEIYSQPNQNEHETFPLEADILFIGITAPIEEIKKRIIKRVDKRIKQGMEGEVESLLRMGVDWSDQSMATPGYRQWKNYMEGKIDMKTLKDNWTLEELQYAKRQMTWFKKDKRILWFDSTDKYLAENVAKLVKVWYSNE